MAKRGRVRGSEATQPPPVSLDPVVRAIESLRRLRVHGEPARTMGESFVKEGDQLARSRASLGSVLEAWERVVPPELQARCWPSALSRRVLTVVVADAGTGYEFSMWLRGGGEGQLRTAAKTAVSRVKVEVTGHQTGRSTAGSKPCGRFDGGCFQFRPTKKIKIVVRGKIDHCATVYGDFTAARGQWAQGTQQVCAA